MPDRVDHAARLKASTFYALEGIDKEIADAAAAHIRDLEQLVRDMRPIAEWAEKGAASFAGQETWLPRIRRLTGDR